MTVHFYSGLMATCYSQKEWLLWIYPFFSIIKSLHYSFLLYYYWTLLKTTIYLKDQMPQALHIKYTCLFPYLASCV